MKKMKRLLALVLAGVLALAMLTACGGSVPDDENTARLLRNSLLPYMSEALPKETKVGGDVDLQKIAAEEVRQNWTKGKADVVSRTTEKGQVMVSWLGITVTNQELPALLNQKAQLVEMVKSQDDTYYEKYGVHAEKGDVYTVAHGNDVLFAFVLQYPKTAK